MTEAVRFGPDHWTPWHAATHPDRTPCGRDPRNATDRRPTWHDQIYRCQRCTVALNKTR